MADYIYVVQMDVPDELEDAFNRIYDTQHVPCILNAQRIDDIAATNDMATR